MKRVLLAAAMVLGCAACVPPEPPLEIKRDAPPVGAPPQGDPVDVTHADDSDAGPPELDAGVCCPVLFQLPAAVGEVECVLKIVDSSRYLPLDLDGGVWSTTACMPLAPARYFYELGLTADGQDGDAGLFVMTRVNTQVTTELSGAADLVNVFDPGGAASCGELDAGVHAELPDAG